MRNKGVLHISGLHFDPDEGTFTSSFTSDYVMHDGNKLIIFYSSVGVDHDIFMRQGIFHLATEGVPPRKIYGVWTDVLPAQNAGAMHMKRRDNETEAILINLDYPMDYINKIQGAIQTKDKYKV